MLHSHYNLSEIFTERGWSCFLAQDRYKGAVRIYQIMKPGFPSAWMQKTQKQKPRLTGGAFESIFPGWMFIFKDHSIWEPVRSGTDR